MTSRGTVKLSVVWEMLDHCAKGHSRHEGRHNWTIRFAGTTYPSFPAGAHTKKKEIEIGHVRRLVRYFGLQECAKKHFPGLL